MTRVPKMLLLCRQTAFSLSSWVNWRRASALCICLQVSAAVERTGPVLLCDSHNCVKLHKSELQLLMNGSIDLGYCYFSTLN